MNNTGDCLSSNDSDTTYWLTNSPDIPEALGPVSEGERQYSDSPCPASPFCLELVRAELSFLSPFCPYLSPGEASYPEGI